MNDSSIRLQMGVPSHFYSFSIVSLLTSLRKGTNGFETRPTEVIKVVSRLSSHTYRKKGREPDHENLSSFHESGSSGSDPSYPCM